MYALTLEGLMATSSVTSSIRNSTPFARIPEKVLTHILSFAPPETEALLLGTNSKIREKVQAIIAKEMQPRSSLPTMSARVEKQEKSLLDAPVAFAAGMLILKFENTTQSTILYVNPEDHNTLKKDPSQAQSIARRILTESRNQPFDLQMEMFHRKTSLSAKASHGFASFFSGLLIDIENARYQFERCTISQERDGMRVTFQCKKIANLAEAALPKKELTLLLSDGIEELLEEVGKKENFQQHADCGTFMPSSTSQNILEIKKMLFLCWLNARDYVIKCVEKSRFNSNRYEISFTRKSSQAPKKDDDKSKE